VVSAARVPCPCPAACDGASSSPPHAAAARSTTAAMPHTILRLSRLMMLPPKNAQPAPVVTPCSRSPNSKPILTLVPQKSRVTHGAVLVRHPPRVGRSTRPAYDVADTSANLERAGALADAEPAGGGKPAASRERGAKMINRRDSIRMNDEEIESFLAGRQSLTFGTLGTSGRISIWWPCGTAF
jgi:hypothetical protein